MSGRSPFQKSPKVLIHALCSVYLAGVPLVPHPVLPARGTLSKSDLSGSSKIRLLIGRSQNPNLGFKIGSRTLSVGKITVWHKSLAS